MKTLKWLICFNTLVFGSIGFSDSEMFNLIGVSADGRYVSYEIYGDRDPANGYHCQIRFWDAIKNIELKQIEYENESDSIFIEGTTLARRKCYEKASKLFSQYKIAIGSSVLRLGRTNQFLLNLRDATFHSSLALDVKMVPWVEANEDPTQDSEKKVGAANLILSHFSSEGLPSGSKIKDAPKVSSRKVSVLLPKLRRSSNPILNLGIEEIFGYPLGGKKVLIIVPILMHIYGIEGGDTSYFISTFTERPLERQ